MKKRITAAALTAAMTLSMAAAPAQAIIPVPGMTVFADTTKGDEYQQEYNGLVYDKISGVVIITGCKDRTMIEELNIPSKIDGCIVKQIAGDAFSNCRCLKKVTIDMGTVYIGKSAFEGCDGLESLSLPTTLQFIDEKAFGGCISLGKVELPGSLQRLGDSAFLHDTALKRVDIPESVLDIGDMAFGYLCDGTKYDLTLGVYADTAGEEYAISNGFDPVYLKKSIKDAEVYVTSPVVYKGKACKPSVSVDMWMKTLQEGVDYKLVYSGNNKCGKAKVTFKGIGKYKDEISKSFIIKPGKAAAKKLTSPRTKTLKLTWKKSAGGVTGYKVQFSPDKKFGKSVKTCTIKKPAATSKTIKGMKKGRTYFARVCAYKTVGKKTYKGAWSKTLKVKCR